VFKSASDHVMHPQAELYGHVLRSKAVSSLLTGAMDNGGADALSVITTLRKLCNHPDLLHAAAAASREDTGNGSAGTSAAEGLQQQFPADYERGDSSQSGEY